MTKTTLSLIYKMSSTQLIILKPNSHFTCRYGDSQEMTTEHPFYDRLNSHPRISKPLINAYLGQGFQGLVVADKEDNYHCLVVGGNNGYTQLDNEIAYELYSFDQPAGKVADLNAETEITFCDMELDDEVYKYYKTFFNELFVTHTLTEEKLMEMLKEKFNIGTC